MIVKQIRMPIPCVCFCHPQIESGSLPSLDATAVQAKYDRVIEAYTNAAMNQDFKTPNDPLSRLFNETVWEQMGQNILSYANGPMDL